MSRLILSLVLLALSAQSPLLAQVLIRVSQANQIVPVANGGSVTVASTGVGQQTPVTLSVTYTGTGTSLTFRGAPELLGSTEFTFLDPPPSNLSLGPGQTATFRVAFTPTSSQITSADFNLDYTETFPEPVAPRSGVVAVGLNGVTPDLRLAYGFAVDGNVVPLPEQDAVIPFLPTPINSTTTASLILANRGSGPGRLISATVSGDAFSILSLPFLPATLAANGSLQFQIRYRPRGVATDTGTLTLTYGSGQTYTVALTGSGVASYFSYELLPPDQPSRPIEPNTVVVLPSTRLGERSTSWVRLTNTSAFDLNVAAIAVTGAGFSLTDVPFLPLVVAPGDSQFFSIVFTPTQAGRQTGRLRVGNDTFELAGEAIGPVLSYSYQTTAGVSPVQPLEAIVFTGVNVGDVSTVDFTIENRGSAPAPIANIGIASDTRNVFSIVGLPPLPSSIAPGQSVTFRIQYKPVNQGAANATLLVNGVAFPLVAIANDLVPLPDFTITGPTTVQAFEQPRVGLTLASPYPVTLRGVLTITPESDNSTPDPAVQFSSGGRQASFTIPAGSTQAVFFNGATDIRFQAGSVAGGFFLQATFVTPGGLDLTPETPRVLRIALPATAPRILTATVAERTDTTLAIDVSGVTSTRSLTRMDVTFKGKPGFNLPQTTFTLDLTGPSLLWFSIPGSSGFGGQFTARVPFVLSTSSTSSDAVPPTRAIESVSLTITNDRGTSSSVTVMVQ